MREARSPGLVAQFMKALIPVDQKRVIEGWVSTIGNWSSGAALISDPGSVKIPRTKGQAGESRPGLGK